ncbi:MAG: GGDEF domain-containing protein [Candidatus Cloacimonadales bacterium]
MHNFYVLNLSDDKDFGSVLNTVAQELNFTVINSLEAFPKPGLVFIDVNSIDFKAKHNTLHYIGVGKNSEDITIFFKHDIFNVSPVSITKQQMKPLFTNYSTLMNANTLVNTFKQGSKFDFDDFVFFADLIFVSCKRGIAFLSSELNILMLNSNFSTYFSLIFDKEPKIGELVTKHLPKENATFWETIVKQGNKLQSSEVELDSKNGELVRYYKLQVFPVFKDLAFFGYSVLLEDVSEFTNANIDLVRYYKYLLEHNENLEKAYKEVELNNEKLKIAYEKVNALSNRDYLTQAPNRKFFLEKIEYEQLRFKRTKSPFILAYGDIDNFKKVNDVYGHEAGDYVLVTLTTLIKDTIRNIDFFCRWGGEEFLIFLAESDIVNGKIIAERIIASIRDYKFQYHEHNIKITMTLGIALYKEDQHINKIIDLADKRLYWGKQNNKDQVVCSTPDEENNN